MMPGLAGEGKTSLLRRLFLKEEEPPSRRKLDLPVIFEEIEAARQRLLEEEARVEELRIEKLRQKKAKCDELRPGLQEEALAKAERWLRENLIREHELLEVEYHSFGVVFHLLLENWGGEEEEHELRFEFYFDGNSLESFQVRWVVPKIGRKDLEEYYPE